MSLRRTKKRCGKCFYDGSCNGMPYCNGAHFRPAFVECSCCGVSVEIEEAIESKTEKGKYFCEKCFPEEE